MIKTTTDLSIFKYCEGNRGIDPTNLKKVIASIKIRNLLHLRPILVNSKMEVLDGQHRLEAARTLNLPISYDVSETCNITDIPLMNIQKSWTLFDVMNFYCSQGFQDYIDLQRVMKKYNVKFGMAMRIFGGKERAFKEFRSGGFKFPKGDDLAERIKDFEKIQIVQDYLISKLEGNSSYVLGTRFAQSLRSFLFIRSVNFDLFMKKIEYRLDLVRPCHNTKTFIQMFKQIYNYKNLNPITSEEDLLIEEN